jgi:hypothetical protein
MGTSEELLPAALRGKLLQQNARQRILLPLREF